MKTLDKTQPITHGEYTLTHNPGHGGWRDQAGQLYASVSDLLSRYGTTQRPEVARIRETAAAASNQSPPPHKPRDGEEKAIFRHAWDAARGIVASAASTRADWTIFAPAYRLIGTIDLAVRAQDGGLHIHAFRAQGQDANLELGILAEILIAGGYLRDTQQPITLHTIQLSADGVRDHARGHVRTQAMDIILRHVTEVPQL